MKIVETVLVGIRQTPILLPVKLLVTGQDLNLQVLNPITNEVMTVVRSPRADVRTWTLKVLDALGYPATPENVSEVEDAIRYMVGGRMK